MRAALRHGIVQPGSDTPGVGVNIAMLAIMFVLQCYPQQLKTGLLNTKIVCDTNILQRFRNHGFNHASRSRMFSRVKGLLALGFMIHYHYYPSRLVGEW